MRAWADDLAMVIPQSGVCLRLLQDFFLDFSRVSGLHLNVAETVVVPLFNFVEADVRDMIIEHAPDWGGVRIAAAAKYLGFFVGPGRGSLSWKAPLVKYIERASSWGRLGLGLFITMQAYQVFVSSVLQFVAQLEDVPESFDQCEQQACRALFPGPRRWMVPTCIKDAKYLGLPKELGDLKAIAVAAKARVVKFGNRAHGGLRVHERVSRLLYNDGADCSLAHIRWWSSWAKQSFLIKLAEADRNLSGKISVLDGNSIDMERQMGWQGRVTPLFRSVQLGASMLHIRRRMDRWNMLTLPGHRPGRARTVLGILGRHSNPRVQAAYLRSICNGWCTKGRFQKKGNCAFGCGGGVDKLEHYARCTVVGGLLSSHSNLDWDRGHGALDALFCMNTSSQEEVVQRSLGLYALYRLHNGLRYNAFLPQDMAGAFHRFVCEGKR